MDTSREDRSELEEQVAASSDISRISSISAVSNTENVERNPTEPDRTSQISIDIEGLRQVLENLSRQEEPSTFLRTTDNNEFAPIQPVSIGDSNAARSLQGQDKSPRREAGMEFGPESPTAILRKPVPVRGPPQGTNTGPSNLYDHEISVTSPAEGQHPDPVAQTALPESPPDENLRTETFVEGSPTGEREISNMWNPVWLQYTILIALMATFCLIGAALGLLYHFSQIHGGISAQITTNHYSWTYGPTAVLVLISVCWHQLEYFCMILTPWKHLRRGYTEAENTLLLDYVSRNIFVALFSAWEHGHWAVAAAISGSQILRLTIFSTGLLVLEPIAMREESFPLKTTTVFSGDFYSNYTIDFATESLYGFNEPVKTYFGAFEFGMPLPEGTSDGVAFQTFEAAKTYPPNSTIFADVLGFWPSFGCEIPKVQYTLPPSDYEAFINATTAEGGFLPVWPIILTTSRCSTTITQIGNVEPPSPLVEWCNPRFQVCPTGRQVAFDHQLISCNATNNTVQPTGWEGMWAVTLTSAEFDQTLPPGANTTVRAPANATSWKTSLNVSTVVCVPTYTMKETQVKVDTSKNGTGFENEVLGSKIGNGTTLLPDFKFEAIDATIAQWFSDIFGSYSLGLFNSNSRSGELLGAFMRKYNNNSDLTAFLDEQTLLDTASGVYERLATILMSNSTRLAANDSFAGTLEYNEGRLVVQKTSVIAMSVGMGLLVAATSIIIFSRPHNEVPLAPNSIGHLAILLSSSTHLLGVLKATGQSRTSALRRVLGAYRYQYRTITTTRKDIPPHFVIELSENERVSFTAPKSPVLKWWRPFPVSIWFIMTQSILIVGIIIVLEIVQRKSDSNSGFVSVKGSIPLARRCANYISAVVMLLLAISIERLETVSATLAPFQALKNRQAGSRIIMTNYLGKWTLHTIWISLRLKQYEVTFTAIASFIASFLTIVVSGLYLVQSTAAFHRVDVPRTDQWALKATDAGNIYSGTGTDNFAAAVFQLIEFSNLSYPQFTFDQEAIPQVSAPNSGGSSQFSSATSMAVEMTALRAKLTCYDISTSSTQFNFSMVPDDLGTGQDDTAGNGDYSTFKVLQVHALLEQLHNFSCPNSKGQNALSVDYKVNVPPPDPSQPKYFGLFSDPALMVVDFGSASVLSLPLRPQDNCPTLAFTFGRWALEPINSTTSPEYTHFLCSQNLERVQSEVTFLLPSLTIDTTHKPTSKSEEPPYLSANEYNLWNPALGFNLEEFFPPDYTNKSDEAYDYFFRGMFYGGAGNLPSRDRCLGPDNADTLYGTIQNFYRRYMAQVMNANFRIPGTDPLAPTYAPSNWSSINAPLTFKATVSVPDERIFQNNVSKIILQVLLGLILVFSVWGWFLMDKGKVLTHDPNSIAGLGSWIAGGGLADMEGHGLEHDWMSRRDFRAERMFENRTYSLGWWPVGTGVGSGARQDDQLHWSKHEGERFGIDVGRARRPS